MKKNLIDNISQVKGISFDFRPIDPSQKAAEYQDMFMVMDHLLCAMHYTLRANCWMVLRTYDKNNYYPDYSFHIVGTNKLVEGLIVFFSEEDFVENMRLFTQEFGLENDEQEARMHAKMCQIFDNGEKNAKN